MPKRVKSLLSLDIYEIEYWDMTSMTGRINNENKVCSLVGWEMDYGYIPVD